MQFMIYRGNFKEVDLFKNLKSGQLNKILNKKKNLKVFFKII